CLLDFLEGDGAHLALFLGDDQIWARRAQGVLFDAVDAEAVAHQPAYRRVDLERRPTRIELRLGQHRAPDDLGGKVTLMRDADHLIGEAEGADDFGRAGKERGDAHLVASVSSQKSCTYSAGPRRSWRR